MSILIMMNNYFHDLATAFLAAATLLVLMIDRQLTEDSDPAVVRFYINLYRKFTRIAGFALVWIIIAGIPRTIYFKQIEWNTALGNGIFPALIIKHILMFLAVVMGLILWRKTARKVKKLDKNETIPVR